MFRIISTAIATAVLTTGAVAALADTGDSDVKQITINDAGDYCLEYRATTGTRLGHQECLSKAEWAQQGVTFNH